MAWIIARTDTPYTAQLEGLISLPIFIPTNLTAMAWAMLGNPQVGLLNSVWKRMTGATTSPINIYANAAMCWRSELVQSIFRGASRPVRVRTSAGLLNLDTTEFDPPALGAQVTVAADANAAWALPPP